MVGIWQDRLDDKGWILVSQSLGKNGGNMAREGVLVGKRQEED